MSERARLTKDEREALGDWWDSADDDGWGLVSLGTAVEAILTHRLAAIQALADQWNETPDYRRSEYDKGRVDQRHDMLGQLLEALEVRHERRT